MRLTVTVVAMAVLVGLAAAQLNVGPQGLSTPPINVVALFRLLRDVVNHMLPSSPLQAEEKEATTGSIHALEKTGRKCLSGEPCWPWLVDDDMDDEDDDGEEEGNDDEEEGDEEEEEEEEEEEDYYDILESKYVVTKWIMAYVGIIIACSVITLVIGFPYLITGQTFRSFDSSMLPVPDHQDSLLLLTWLLGEASGDESCLERVVCLTPERSARYLTLPNAITTFFSRWVPVRYQKQLKRLGDVTENGIHHTCEQYSCSVLPDL